MNKIIYRILSFVVALALTLSGITSASASSLAAARPDYMIISRDSLMTLPTSGSAWNTLKSSADASATPDLCNQDNKADVNALAAGIVYARTGNDVYRVKVINLINKAMASQRDGCYNAILAMGRQLGGYVLAADFANYRDPSFTTWLTAILDRNVGGHSRWNILRFTAYDSASNWGVHALASLTTADIYLSQATNISKDWEVFSAYGKPQGWPFNKASSFNEQWSCVTTGTTGKLPIAINSPCIKSGINLDGAPVEDSSRSAFGAYSSYIHESLQGYAVMAQLFERTGLNGWAVNNSQVCRAAKFGNRAGRLNDNGVSYFVAFMANRFCGLNLPTKTPTSNGRMFAFSDWLFGSGSAIPATSAVTAAVAATQTLAPLPTNQSTVIPTSIATLVTTSTPTAIQTFTSAPTNTPTTFVPSQTAPTLPAGQNSFDVRVASGADDVEERSTGNVYTTSNDLELVYDTDNQVVGFRFIGVNIPKGAIITNAYLQFTSDEISSDVTTLSIQGDASPNALAFASTTRNVSSRLKTKTAVVWSPAPWLTLKAMGPEQRTPNLALIVQEVVNQSGWTTGNSMVLIIAGSGKRVARAYEINPSDAPLLHIEFTLAASATSTPTMTATITPSGTPTASPTIIPTEISPTVTQLPPAPSNTETPIPPTIIIVPTETPTEVPATP